MELRPVGGYIASVSLAIIVHGGAGNVPPEFRDEHSKGIQMACRAGRRILEEKGSSIDAVVAAVRILEDNPAFNAGTGAVLNRAGYVELDAGLMEGSHLRMGCVAGVRDVANPIEICRVLLTSDYNFFCGADASRIAEKHQIPRIDPESLITDRRRLKWEQGDFGTPLDTGLASDTVGAVALDLDGLLAAGTSTGGINGKPPGRVGDSPLPGGGFYADNGVGACSTTGLGEALAKILASRRALEGLERGLTAQTAAENVIDYLESRLPEATGGLILIDAEGNLGMAYNSSSMTRAWWNTIEGEGSGF